MKWVGIKNNKICFISSEKIVSDEYNIVQLPTDEDDILLNYNLINNQLIKRESKKINNLKIAFIGNWKMNCGISTYSEKLLPFILNKTKDYKLFIEHNENPTSQFNLLGDKLIDENKITQCWKRGEDLSNLIKQLEEYNPDIIFIQHEFGLWPNARYWLSMMTQLSKYRVIVTMHSTFYHKDKAICEACIPEIVVHLDGAKETLKNKKQIAGKVHVIPHGCDYFDQEKLWNIYRSDRTFLQFGFGFKYKGWENSLKIVSILKQKYDDIFFTGLFSESNFSLADHKIYYDELMALANDLGIKNNISLIRGFQSDEILNSFIKTNKAAIFPYVASAGHEVWGASGAARMVMSKNIPVITSNVNHFSDLPTLKGSSVEEMAEKLDLVLNNKKIRQEQLKKQKEYVLNNSWENVANRYIEIFEE